MVYAKFFRCGVEYASLLGAKAWCLVLGLGCASAQWRRRWSFVSAYIGKLAGRVARLLPSREWFWSFWCRFGGCLIASTVRSISEVQEDRSRFSSFGSGCRSELLRSHMGTEDRCLDSSSSQHALSGGNVPAMFSVHGDLVPPQSAVK
ncbi:hypothetical protein YC2023_095720 [Brassica napus]